MLPRAAGTLVASKQSVLNTPDLPLNEKKFFFFFSLGFLSSFLSWKLEATRGTLMVL